MMLARFLVDHSLIAMNFSWQDGSKAVLKGKPTSASCNTLLKPHSHRGPIKKIAWDHGTLPSTKDEILELLHDFVNQFLSGGYNGMSFLFDFCFMFVYLVLLHNYKVRMCISFDAVNSCGY